MHVKIPDYGLNKRIAQNLGTGWLSDTQTNVAMDILAVISCVYVFDKERGRKFLPYSVSW